MGALTSAAGEGTVQINRTANAALTFASLASRSAGATANFSLSGGTPSAANGFVLTGAAQGFVNQGFFFGGADYAYMDGAGTFVRAPIDGADSGFTTPNTLTANTHVKLTATPAAQNTLTLNTLNLTGSGVGLTINSGQVISLANGGVLKAGGGSAGAISGGNVQTTDSSRDLVVRTDSASDALNVSSVLGAVAPPRTGTATSGSAIVTGLSGTSDLYVGMTVVFSGVTGFSGSLAFTTIKTIDSASQITLNTTSAVTGTETLLFSGTVLTKSGAGTLTLTGANTNLVGVNLNAGQLNINSSTALGTGVSPSLTGAPQNVPIGTLTINDGTTIDNTSGSALAMIYKYRIALNGSFTFVGSSDLYFVDPNQNGNIRMPNDVTVTTQTKDRTLRFASNFGLGQGVLTPARLTKNGPGTLQIGSNGGSGLNGGLVINEGVYASFAGPTTGQSDQAYSGPLFLGDTTPGNSHVAILDFWYGNPHGAPITVRAGSSGTLAMYGAGNNNAGPTVYGPTVLNNTLTLGTASSSTTFSHYGVISGPGGLSIGNTNPFTVFGTTYSLTNAGTVALFNRNTYTGNTVINSGTLKLGALGTINNSPLLSLGAGTTLDVSGTTNYTLSASTTLSAGGITNTVAGWARIVGPANGTFSLGAQPINLAFTPASLSGDSTHPALYVSQGSLTLNNNAITVTNNSRTPLGAGAYTLIQVASATIIENPSPAYPVRVAGAGLAPNSTATVANVGGNVVLTVVTPDVTAFSALTPSQTIQQGAANVVLAGTVGDTNGVLAAPFGDTVYVTINGVTNSTTVNDAAGDFTIIYDTHLLPASGTPYTIKYSYAGNATTTPPLLGCVDATTTLTVSPKTVPVISAWPTALNDIIYGQALSHAALSSGTASDPNTLAPVPGTWTFTAPLTVPGAVGPYAASGTFTPANASLYSIVVLPGAISVTVDQRPAGLASPSVPPRPYDGTPVAIITGTLTNLLAGDVGQVTLAGTGTFGTPAPDVGTSIAVVDVSGLSLTGAKAANYLLTPPTGLSGAITQAVLAVTADNLGRAFGATNPPLTYTVIGYQTNYNTGTLDDAGTVGLTGSPGLSTTATITSPVGTYPILCTNIDMALTSGDYSLTFVNGQLQVVGLRTWAKGNGVWDIQTSTNWTSASGPATYVDGGAVLFSDAAPGIAPFTVTLSTNVSPDSMTVSNASKDYLFSGAGTSINGAGSLTKQGNATLTLGMANAYNGGTTVSGGTLQYGSKYAFGTGTITLAGGVTWRKISEEGNAASLATTNNLYLSGGSVTTDISRYSAGSKDMWLTGVIDGPGGLVLINDGASRGLTLANANTFGGGVRLLNGVARVYLQTVNSLGTGTLRCDLLAPAVASNGSIGGLANTTFDLSAGVTNAIDIAPGANLDIGWNSSANMLLTGPIFDGGGLTVWGTGTLTLSGANTYGGATVVNNGTLEIVNASSLGSGPLSIGNALVQLDYSGTAPVTSLTLDKGGTYLPPGVYGSSASGAANSDDTHFTGSGTVTVGPAATRTTLTSMPAIGTRGSSVTLTASVVAQSPSLATVNEGTVTFTVTNGLGATLTSVTSGTVTAGAASANLLLTNASLSAGIYGLRATYNPAATPPNFAPSVSALAGVLIVKDTPVFSNLASQSVSYGTASVVLGGTLSTTTVPPAYPAPGETVTATINGVPHTGTVQDAAGDFSITYPVGTNLAVSGTPYPITYSYAGNGTILYAAPNNSTTTLTVTNAAAPVPALTSFAGPAGGRFTVQGSTDIAGHLVTMKGTNVAAPLNTWVPIQTNPVSGGPFSFTIPQGTDSQAFYRLKGQP